MTIDLNNFTSRTMHDAQGETYAVLSHDLYLYAALDWLMRAQDVTHDGGVSAQYDLLRGWDDSYIETTGYILVSFFEAAKVLGEEELRRRAINMADFLVKVQLTSGAFSSGTPQDKPTPRVFNTGEDIRGLMRAYLETKKQKYLHSAVKAADWLVSVQEKDGSWLKDEFQGRKHAYHSRTAWALLSVWQVTKSAKYRSSAVRSLDWVLAQQINSGWFAECDFTSPLQPFTHAIDYTISGLMESGRILKSKKYQAAAKRAADALLHYYRKIHFMPATFNPNWLSDDRYTCLTGDAQIALTWMELYEHTKKREYLEAADEILTDVKSTVDLLTNDLSIRGAVPGAYPIYGGYSRWNYPNWATKFFFDALLKYRQLKNK